MLLEIHNIPRWLRWLACPGLEQDILPSVLILMAGHGDTSLLISKFWFVRLPFWSCVIINYLVIDWKLVSVTDITHMLFVVIERCFN